MKDYKRLTERDRYWQNDEFWQSSQEPSYEDVEEIYYRLAELEDKIERGELDYVADRDKEIARLTAEISELRETLSKMETVEKELRERLEKAVILPMLQVVKGNRRPYELVYKDQNGRVIISKYRPYDKYEAEARLAELKGG